MRPMRYQPFYIGDYDALTNDFCCSTAGSLEHSECKPRATRMSWPRGWRRRTSGSARGGEN